MGQGKATTPVTTRAHVELGLKGAAPQRLRAVDRLNLLVLVGGTSQPVNLGEIKGETADPLGGRSQGHSDAGVQSGQDYWGKSLEDLAKLDLTDVDWYWQKDEKLRKALSDMSAEYHSFKIFPAHGWSGDNAIGNRRVAGAYLANRLCGAEGEQAFYSAWRHRRVDLHLMGHSHGGNVVNEFLRQAARLGAAWPAGWRVRSMTYLSTPFFQALHPIDVAILQPECQIINVIDDYDLTQRVVADFSMLALRGVLTHAGIEQLKDGVSSLKLDWDIIREALVSARPSVRWSWRDPVPVLMDAAKGRTLYKHLLSILQGIDRLLIRAAKIVDTLTEPVEFAIAPGLQGKAISTKRPLLSKAAAGDFKALLQGVRQHLAPLTRRLTARSAGPEFPLGGFFEDLFEGDVLEKFVRHLVGLLAIDPDSLEGPLLNLALTVVLEQVEQFDDTTTSPAGQLAGTPFTGRVCTVNVTSADLMADDQASSYATRYPKFIRCLESAERAYAATRDDKHLKDLLLVLLVQDAKVREIMAQLRPYQSAIQYGAGYLSVLDTMDEALSWISERNEVLQTLALVGQQLRNWMIVLSARDFGQLQVPEATLAPDPGDPPVGSLNHFMMVAHSVSRRQLHPEVETLLRAQITSLRKHNQPAPKKASGG